MRKVYVSLLTVLIFLFTSVMVNAQLSGVKTIPGDYATITAAVTDLNAQGVGAGGVTFNVAAGYTETITAVISLTATGTVANPIVFQKSGVGANPVITAYVGTNTPATASHDDMWRLIGSDYVTIDGINLTDPNVTNPASMEGGFVLYKSSLSDGAQNNTIKNCVITLNRVNNAAGSGPSVEGSRGIEVTNATAAAAITSLTPTTAAGTNSNNKFYGNTIQNCNYGIVLSGFAASTPFTAGDTGNDIGGSAPATGNTILNYGGGAATSPAAAVRANNQWSVNISYNTINNNNGSGVSHTTTLRGIYAQAGTSANATINNNNITISCAATTSQAAAIENAIGSTAAGNTVTINNNSFSGNYLTATSGVFYGIYNTASPATINIEGNTISGMAYSAAGLAGSGVVYPIYNTGAATNINVRSNTINNITRTGTTGNSTIGIYVNGGTNQTVKLNTVSNMSIDGAGTASIMYGIQTVTGTIVVDSNNVFNLSCIKTTGTGAMYGIYNFASPTNENYNYNKVYNLSHSGTGITYGIYTNTAAGIRTVSNNEIYSISSGGTTVAGIAQALSSPNIFRNKIYNIQSTSTAAPIVSGLVVSSGTTVSIYNNLIGDIKAPNATGATAAAPTVRGINLTTTTAPSTIAMSYNTIYLNASGGTNFGTAGLFATVNATATTAALTLRNNIIVNKSIPSGIGLAVAYQRSGTALNNYVAASNNNLFYGGTPGSSNLIFYDGTNSFNDITTYLSFINSIPADQNSVTEDVVFQSITGSSTDFLKYDATVVSKAEAGAENISGITDDYIGTIRQGNPGYLGTALKPDIGAWELNGAQPSCSGMPAASNTVASVNPGCAGQPLTLSLSQIYLGVTYQWQSSSDNITYNNIGAANAPTYLTTATVTTWYQCIITCAGNNRISTPIQVVVNPAMSGAYTINNLAATAGTNFNNFADAITALNCRGVSGPVVFNVSGGQIFNEVSDLTITYEGTAVNTITFQKSGAGFNPRIVRLGTAAATDHVLRLNGADYITFDGIDIDQAGGSSADWVEYGIYLTNSSVINGAQNNTFKNGTVSLSSSNSGTRCVNVNSGFTPTATSGTNSNNRFLNMTVQNSFYGYRFVGATNSLPDNSNEVNIEASGSSTIQNLGDGATASDIYGVFAAYQTGFKVRNTTVTNLTNTGTGFTCGINAQTSTANDIEFSNNTVSNVAGGGNTYILQVSAGATANIFNNTVHTISTTSTTGTSSNVKGVFVSATAITSNIYGNKIYGLTSVTTSTPTSVGIEIGTGTVHNVYNNMISGLSAPASTNTSGGTKGIATSGTTAGQIARVYYNTVELSDAGAGAYTSAGFYNSSTTPVVDFRNNIIVNRSTSATGRIVAYWKNAATINQDVATNNNLYYAGSPGSNNLLYYDGTNEAQTTAAIQAVSGLAPRESLSVTENVNFAPIINGIIRPAATPTLVESSGQIIAGYSIDFENTARGAYPLAGQVNGGGIAPDLGADEGDFAYIAPVVPNCPTLDEPINTSVDICSYNGATLKWTPASTGGLVTLGYDVFFGTNPIPPFLANTSGQTYPVTGLLPNTTYYWKVLPKNSTGSAVGCATYSFTTINAAITSTTGGSRCGPGTVNLNATGSGTINWYVAPTGGTPLATGAMFTTPSISTTTTYYTSASVGGGTINTAKLAPDPSATATSLTTYGQIFTLTQPVLLNSVQVFSTTGTAITISLYNSSGTTQLQTTGSVAVTAGSSPQINLGWSIPAGTYRLSANGMTGNFLRDGITTPSVVYPIALGTLGQIDGYHSAITGTLTTGQAYYFMYNWSITTGCESLRVPVTATINTPPAINASVASPTICAGQSTQLNVTSSNAGYTYVWNPGNLAGASPSVSPITATTYTVTATDNSAGPNAGCINTAIVNVSVNPIPSAVTVTPSNGNFCSGAPAQLLTANGGIVTGGTVLSENFNGSAPGWTMVNNSTGGTVANSDWTFRPDGYTYGATPVTFNSNDNSQFIISNADAQGSGSTTNTDLLSPIFSLAGYTNPTLSFYHYYRDLSTTQPNDSATVYISTNGGGAWTQLAMYNAATGASNSFFNTIIDLSAYAGQSNLKLKFNFYATWDWYWAIDNLSVTGDQTANITWSPTTNLYTNAAATIPYTGGAATSVYALPLSNQTYTATATNSFSCTNSGTATITIVPQPTATISYTGSPYCSTGGTATVTQTGSIGGTYSSTAGLSINPTTGAVNLAASTAGTYTVTYTIAAANGCSQLQTTTSITIVAAPSASISYPGSPYCSGGGTATVTLTGTIGGTYSSTAGLSINSSTGAIDLAASTVGTYTVTYTIAAGACPQYQTTTSVMITTSPSATISYPGSPYCSNGVTATVNQTGSSGGTYSSTAGLAINASTGAVDIAASTPGTYIVTYSIAAAGGCSAFQTTTGITITTAPSATISYAGSPYCSNGGTASVTRTGTAGGTYTSTAGLTINASTGAVTLGTSTAGTYTVTYTVAAANGCAQFQTTASITITAAPAATISYAGSPYCSNGGTASVSRTGTAGGTYTSTAGLSINASTGAVTLGTSTPGTYTVTYTVAAANGCAQFQTTGSIAITAAPAATISYAGSPYCTNGGTATVTQTGTAGGTYTSTAGLSINASTGAVNLGASTAGTYTVTYTVAAANGCAQFQTTGSITITAAPAATISYAGSPYCSNGGTASVTRTGTAGGTYTSTAGLSINASTGAVTLGTSTPGTYTVTYTVAAANGCAQLQTTASIVVTAAPAATISYAGSPYCSNGTTATVTQTGTAGGTYTSTAGLSINASTGAVNLGASTAGTYTVTYTVAAANGCAQFQTTTSITVTAAPTATIAYAGSPFCISGTVSVTQTGTAGGTYTSTAGLSINASTGQINLATSTAGAYTITYTVAAANGCAQFQTTTNIVISTNGSWLGTVSSNWNTAANWCGGVPTSTTDVTIPSTAPNMPNLSAANGTARNISIANGAILTIGAGGILDLYGNITGAGVFNATAGSIAFRSATGQTVPGFTATNVTMNGAGGVTPAGNTTVTGTLTLTNGNITLGSNSITLNSTSTGSTASHIITNGTGNVVVANLAASQTRTIPVGADATSYNPATLTANATSATDNFNVRVQQGVFVNGVSGTTYTTHVADRMWIINEVTPGGSNVNVTLQWTGTQELTSFNRTKCYVMQHNGTAWSQGTATASAGADPYTQTKQNVTTFSPFAVETERIPRPVTGIYPNPTSDVLNVVTDLLNGGLVVFSVYDMKGRLVYRRQETLSAGLSQTTLNLVGLSAGTYVMKASTALNREFLSQKFIKVN